MERFERCLAHLLRQETGYPQPEGGPFRRNHAGTNDLPKRPDGNWYDDDQDDTGGRTAAGILQREYDPWRRAKGLDTRDVWLIEDDEIRAIYHSKYWEACGANRVPAGLDLALFDFAVLCGVGTAVRRLQSILHVRLDGHYGPATHDAVTGAESIDTLINQLCDARRSYLRSCKTFWKHGKGWLKRVDRVELQSLKEAIGRGRPVASLPAIEEPVPSRKAIDDQPTTMAQSTTGNAAGVTGVIGCYFGTKEAANALATASANGGLTLANLATTLLSSEAFWLAALSIAAAAYIWFERQRKMTLGF